MSLTSARSASPCATCHGSYYQYLDVLEGDPGNQIPATIDVGATKNVTVVIENLSNARKYTTMSGVSATLQSQNGHFSVKTPTVNIGSFSIGKKAVTWQITGISAGVDNLLITVQGSNTHQGLSFSDSYAPSPSITVAQSSTVPAITLTAPSGGETWLVGSQHNVTWIASGGTGTLKIKLDYNLAGTSGTWTTIANNEVNDGVFLWTVPNMASTNSFIRTTVFDSANPPHNASSINSAPFEITSHLTPKISLTQPFSGLVWSGGSSHLITWNSNSKDIGNCKVSLFYSVDGFDESNITIASLIADTGSFNWTVPLIDSDSVRIKAVLRDPNGQTSESISEPFKVDSTLPSVVSASPSDNSINVSTPVTLSVTFSESVDTSMAEQSFSITPATNAISWTWDLQNRTMTATNAPLSPNTNYSVTVSSGVKDASDPGNPSDSVSVWSFSTASTIMNANNPPVIILEIQEPQIEVNQSATFNASKTFDLDNDTLRFIWDFGDKTPIVESSKPVGIHSFVADGKYIVLLKVSDNKTESLQTMEILVRKPQTAVTIATGSNLEWHVAWAGLLLSVIGVIGVGRAFFVSTDKPLTMETLDMMSATQETTLISSLLPTLLLRKEKCVGCGFCARKCPIQAIRIINKRPVHDPSKCRTCMQCAEKCPRGSITIIPSVASEAAAISTAS